MNKVLYYPTFDVKNEEWLKFALLYIGKLRPIVPYGAEEYLGDITRLINQETDLYDFYYPRYEDSMKASIIAFEQLERIIEHPNIYRGIFGHGRISEQFRDRTTHTFNIFREKYTYDFERYCLEKGFASESNDGIFVNDELGNIYMTIIANCIAENNNIECITDNEKMVKYAIFSRSIGNFMSSAIRQNTPYSAETIYLARKQINLRLPRNLKDISLETIIEFRNTGNYVELLEAYHRELNSYLDSVSSGTDSFEFLENLNNKKNDLRSELVQLTPDLFSFAMGVLLTISDTSNLPINIISSGIMGASIADSVIKIRRLYRNNEDVRFTRKYFSRLELMPE